MKTRFVAVVVALVMAMTLLMAVPARAGEPGPVMPKLQFKFYSGTTALYTALKTGAIDMMAWPLSYDQAQDAMSDPNIQVAPYFDLGDYELAINNNWTCAAYPDWRSPTSYVDFRRAIAYLLDKDGLIAGPALKGFGTRIDTLIPLPILKEWVNWDVVKYGPNGELLNNYPWEYDPYAARDLLDAAGFVQGTEDNPYYDPNIPWSSPKLRVYPPGHEKAGQTLDPLKVYVRNDHEPRLTFGRQVYNHLRLLGIPCDVTEGRSGVCYYPVYIYRTYHLYTAGWSLGRFPIWYYSFFHPIGIYPGGPNFYLVNDTELTPILEDLYPQSTSIAMSKAASLQAQSHQVMKVYTIPVYSSKSYFAYRKGLLGVTTTYGYGLTTALDFTFLTCYHENFPTVNTITYGTLNPPEAINPIFSSWLWDYEVIDRIFTGYMTGNPYRLDPGKIGPGKAGDMPWMAKDWEYTTGADGNAIVTVYFRNDITWHDGTPFTVADLNETIYLGKYYDDSWGYSDFVHVVSTEIVNDYTIKIYFDMPTFWSIYTCNYDIVPKHIYGFDSGKHHPYPNDYETGPHGEWPWKDDPITPVENPEEVWVGTNMWKYVPGTYVSGVGGGILLQAYDNFWLGKYMPGDLDLVYSWTDKCYKIGLSDLVMLANAYGTRGDGYVPFKLPGEKGAYNPAADLASPSCIIGLSDLVTLAKNYGKTWGSYAGK
jgi:ABC-type transport system substrate-binding protein